MSVKQEVALVAPQRMIATQYDVSDLERMARAIAGSKLFGITSPEQALALCLIAQAEGRHPASAAQDYHIVQNRPAKKADAMLRDFLASGGKVEWHTLDDKVADATFSHPAGGSARIKWDHARAKAAGLASPMWTKYPRQMLRSRVVSEGVRTIFPMATSGMYVPEEAQEIEDTPAQKSSFRLKQEGGDDVYKSLIRKVGEAASVGDLQALHKEYALIIAEWPDAWRASFEQEVYDPKLVELQEAAKHRKRKLSPADSEVARKAMMVALDMCKSATDIGEWAGTNRTTFRMLAKEHQEEIARERDARLAEFAEAPDETVDEETGEITEA